MAVIEVTIYRLQDATTFNPMAILELLRQAVTTYSHVSKSEFRAYQEKETHSKFYIVGLWKSLAAQTEFVASDIHGKLLSLLDCMLVVESIELIELHDDTALPMSQPILSLDYYTISKKADFDEAFELVKHHLATATNQSFIGGHRINSKIFVLISGWKSVKDHTITFTENNVSFLTGLQSASTAHESRHIELNQFI